MKEKVTCGSRDGSRDTSPQPPPRKTFGRTFACVLFCGSYLQRAGKQSWEYPRSRQTCRGSQAAARICRQRPSAWQPFLFGLGLPHTRNKTASVCLFYSFRQCWLIQDRLIYSMIRKTHIYTRVNFNVKQKNILGKTINIFKYNISSTINLMTYFQIRKI